MTKNNWKLFFYISFLTALTMTAVIFWDIYALKVDVFYWGYYVVKGITIGSFYLMAFYTRYTKKVLPILEDTYVLLFHAYSFFGMVAIDMTYNFSFIEAFLISAIILRQTTYRFVFTTFIGLILMVAGFYYAKEPLFVGPGESYKPHSMTISFVLLIVAVCTYFLVKRYQIKVDELNEKFALIGKQSSFLMHEIKSPLNRVVANAENDFSEQIMNDIRRDSQKISGLVSSIETLIHHPDRLVSTFTIFNLIDTRAALLTDYGAYLKSMNLQHDFDELQGPFYGNKHLLYQLLKNLLLNAIEAIGYNAEASSTIKINVTRNNKSLIINFWNTNSRIEPHHLSHVFEPHFTTKKSGSNKGLGLCLAKSIVEAHYGTIRANSKDSVTSFEIKVPDYSIT